MNILPHKHSSESKSVSLSFPLQRALVCVCLARSRLKLAVLALGRTRGRGGVTGCWQIRLLSAMQAPVKQATLMSQKNNWRLPPAICCPHSLSIRVASIVSASIRAWRPVQNTLLSTSNISLPTSRSLRSTECPELALSPTSSREDEDIEKIQRVEGKKN